MQNMEPAGSPLVSVVIPVYNGAETVSAVVAEIDAAFADVDYDVILVNDGSTPQASIGAAQILMTQWAANGDAESITPDYANNKITLDVAGFYAVNLQISFSGTANTEFAICIGAQSELDFGGRRNPDGQGFAVFGKVVEGMEVVRSIQKLAETGQYLDTAVSITSIRRVGDPG